METLNFVAKYKKLARRATHSNDWILLLLCLN